MAYSKLKYSESHPLKAELVNKRLLSKEEFVNKYEKFPWKELLEEQLNADDKNIHCSPSLNVENNDGKLISVSIVGQLNDYEFYVCFKRPITRKRKKWFGLIEYDYYDKDFCSVIPEQTKNDGLEAFLLFYEGNFEKLEERW
ncbi:hypothetical protein [Aquimarina sp. AU119]|uniref:hypothetical protein n=1 Tax=Aquimarina sp. AU119 TaxID=2108528 RepID=UPI000D693BDD|nr:hypothetical protein [Aquimarina sp. AU119]